MKERKEGEMKQRFGPVGLKYDRIKKDRPIPLVTFSSDSSHLQGRKIRYQVLDLLHPPAEKTLRVFLSL